MQVAESLLISISGHFQEFYSGFDFELPISFESGKRKKKPGLIFAKKKKMEWVCPLHSFRCLIIKEYLKV